MIVTFVVEGEAVRARVKSAHMIMLEMTFKPKKTWLGTVRMESI